MEGNVGSEITYLLFARKKDVVYGAKMAAIYQSPLLKPQSAHLPTPRCSSNLKK